MLVYRGSRPEHVNAALEGIGAARVPGRWHPKGVAIGYTAQHASLSILEMLVHMAKAAAPTDMRMLTFEVPDDAIYHLPEASWPNGWNRLHYSPDVQAAGAEFIRKAEHLAMLVPSAIVPGERNVLINPNHPKFRAVRLVGDVELVWDPRLFA